MDFSQDVATTAFRAHVHNVMKEQVTPNLRQWNEQNTTPPEMWRSLGDAGLLGFTVDGDVVTPLPWLHNIHYYKTSAVVSGGLSIASFAHSQLGCQALQSYGTDEQKRDILIPAVKGEKVTAFANTEPGAGSDAANLKVTAAADGDGWVVNGAKAYITNGDIADHIVFTAVTHPDEEKKHRRVSMFVVDGNAPGLKRTRMKKQAWKISHLSSLIFDDVRVPKENMVGEPKKGFYQTMHVFNTGRIGVAALAFGAALGAYKAAYDYAGKRQVFGEKLIDHGSKRHEFADNITALEAGWMLIQKAAWLKDNGEEFRFHSSMAKLFATEEAMRVTLWAAETFGARGVLASGDVTRFPDDARGALVGEGAPEVQKKIVAEGIDHLLDGLL